MTWRDLLRKTPEGPGDSFVPSVVRDGETVESARDTEPIDESSVRQKVADVLGQWSVPPLDSTPEARAALYGPYPLKVVATYGGRVVSEGTIHDPHDLVTFVRNARGAVLYSGAEWRVEVTVSVNAQDILNGAAVGHLRALQGERRPAERGR